LRLASVHCLHVRRPRRKVVLELLLRQLLRLQLALLIRNQSRRAYRAQFRWRSGPNRA